MDLLLTHGYFLHEDPKELQIMKPYAPLGLLYLSSYLRATGFEVEIYDSTFGSRDELFRILETERPATLGIYANLMTRANALAILQRARGMRLERDHGRSGTGQLCGQYLAAGAHVVVAGEGELAWRRSCAGSRWNRFRGSSFGPRRQHRTHRSGATACRPRRAALAGPRTHRYRPVPARLARTSRRRIGLRDHRARLPLSLPLVQPFHLRENPPAPLRARRGGRGGVDPQPLPSRATLVRRRRVHHSSRLAG